ncbi:MAG: ROK family protein [Thermaceae bacterium]|nr:ROK family protein [Thermaceae bacterium]
MQPLSKNLKSNVLVADIGGTKIVLGHLQEGQLEPGLQTVSTDLLRVRDPVGAMAEILQGYAQTRGLGPTAAVLGVPVSPDRDLDKVLSSPNIPQLEGVFFASELTQRLGYAVCLERDIALLLLGEYQAGAARGASSALGVFFGTGVGAAMLLGGHPYRGYSVGLELGHIPIRGEGRRCVCGNTDCLEAYACGHTLVELSRQSTIPVQDLFIRQTENPVLEQALREFIRDQAYAVATAINLFDPEVCLVGGGIPEMKGYPRAAFQQTVLEHLRRPYPRETVRLAWAELGPRAALYGALEVLRQRGFG